MHNHVYYMTVMREVYGNKDMPVTVYESDESDGFNFKATKELSVMPEFPNPT